MALFGACSDINTRLNNNESETAEIKAAIGQYTQLKADITSVIQALTADLGAKPVVEQATVWSCISTLKGQSATFDNAIKALEALVGDKPVSEQISSLVSKYQLEGLAATVSAIKDIVEGKGDTPSLTAQIAALKEKTDAINGILARISALETMIQSVTVIPAFSDGSVKVDDNILELKVKVSPAGSIKSLSESQLEDAVKVYVSQVEVITKTDEDFLEADILNIKFIDKEKGVIALSADVFEYLPEDDGHTIAVAVNIRNGISDHTSEFMKVKEVQPVAPDGFVYLGTRNDKGEHIYWAKCNLGAETPEDPGNYYSWGSVEKVYSLKDRTYTFQTANPDSARYTGGWDPEKGFNDCNTPFFDGATYTKYTSRGYLEISDDAAAKADKSWRIPSDDDFYALGENCVWWWTTDYNGKAGYIVYKAKNALDRGKAYIWRGYTLNWEKWDVSGFTPGGAEKPVAEYDYAVDTHIFLPATGYGLNLSIGEQDLKEYLLYWSSLTKDYNDFAYGLEARPEDGLSVQATIKRHLGAAVRPVCSDAGSAQAIPDGALSGTFTVSAEGRKVFFAKGDLWYDGSRFGFEDGQCCFRHYNGITNDKAWLDGGSVTTTPENTVGSFFWSKTGSVAFAKDYSDSDAAKTDIFFTNATETTAKPDFSVDINGKAYAGVWRTLSKPEWDYLLSHNGSVWATVNGVKGRIIFCDGFKGNRKATFDVIPEGCVFLPAAGERGEDGVENTGEAGSYWTCFSDDEAIAYNLFFVSDGVDPVSLYNRNIGCSVRLVTDCE